MDPESHLSGWHIFILHPSAFILYCILPQALVFQLSIASAGRIHGGKGINKKSERATTYGSYIKRSSSSLLSASPPSRSGVPFVARISRTRRNSAGGRRVSQQLVEVGFVLKICAMSTTAWRAIANVNCACQTGTSSTPAITRAQVSSTVVKAPSQDWLS